MDTRICKETESTFCLAAVPPASPLPLAPQMNWPQRAPPPLGFYKCSVGEERVLQG